MFNATTLREVQSLLRMQQRDGSKRPHNRRMCGILFARPASKLAREEIFANLSYFHRRSGMHVDFFCAGVTHGQKELAYRQIGPNDYMNPSIAAFKDYSAHDKESGWLYSDAAFCAFCEELESKTNWRYSGESDLILLDAEFFPSSTVFGGLDVRLDFSEVIVLNLEELRRAEVIPSVASLFEKIIASVKPANVRNRHSISAAAFSDAVGARAISKVTLESILTLLPAPAAKGIKGIGLLATKNIARDA